MLRDTRADEQYFSRVLENFQVHLDNEDERLNNPDTVWSKPMYRGTAAGDVLAYHWANFSALYSAGADLEKLREAYERTLGASERALRLEKECIPEDVRAQRFKFSNSRDAYLQRLWLVSVGIAFGVDDATFTRVAAAVEWGWSDQLLDRLIASRIPSHPLGERHEFPGPTKTLNQAFDASTPVKAASCVQRYLGKWYGAWKGVDGWGGHEYQDVLHYWGYWAFETVGVVKALDLDDASFRDNAYYPRDLLPH